MTALDVTAGGSGPPTVRLSAAFLGLAGACALHAAAVVWWASGMTARVHTVETVLGPPSGPDSLTATIARIDERTARMDKRADAMSRRLNALETHGPRASLGDAP